MMISNNVRDLARAVPVHGLIVLNGTELVGRMAAGYKDHEKSH